MMMKVIPTAAAAAAGEGHERLRRMSGVDDGQSWSALLPPLDLRRHRTMHSNPQNSFAAAAAVAVLGQLQQRKRMMQKGRTAGAAVRG